MAKIPGIDSAVGGLMTVVQLQAEAVRGVAEMASSVRDTVVLVNRLVHRVDALVTELEGPLLSLAPGLQRLAAVLDDEIIDDVPRVLRQVREDVLPVLDRAHHGLRRRHRPDAGRPPRRRAARPPQAPS